MNRAAFLTLYIIIALLLSGGLANPWTITVMALAYGQQGPIALLSPIFIMSVFSPIVLIVLAHLRGKRIGIPRLVWFPVAALGLTLLPLLFGLLTKSFSGFGKEWSLQTIGLYSTMFVAAASSLGPLILHTICCVVGGKRDPASVISTSTRSSATNPGKIVVVMVLLFLLSGGYYYFSRSVNTEKFHWEEEVKLLDGSILPIERSVSKGHPISQQLISFQSNGEIVTWEDKHKWPIDYAPHVLDFVGGDPVIVMPVYRHGPCKEYGYPQEGLVAFRYRQKTWSRMPIQEVPNNLVVNLLEGTHELEHWKEYKGVRVTYEIKHRLDGEIIGPQKQGTTLEPLIKYYSSLGPDDSCVTIRPPHDSKRDAAFAINSAAVRNAKTIRASLERVITTPEKLSNNDRYPKRGLWTGAGFLDDDCKGIVDRLEPMHETKEVGSTFNRSLNGYQFYLSNQAAINRQVQMPYLGDQMNRLVCNGNDIYAISRLNRETAIIYQFTDLGELKQAIKVALPDADKIRADQGWGDFWEVKLTNNELVIVLVDGGGNTSDVLERKQIYRVQLQ